MPEYSTFPGWTKADIKFCLKCKWHGILGTFVTCDYSLYEGNRIRGCRGGVGCEKFDSGKKPEPVRKQRKQQVKMVRCDRAVYRALLMAVGRKEIQELTGYSRSGLEAAVRNERIRRTAAEQIREKFGLDISGGELNG